MRKDNRYRIDNRFFVLIIIISVLVVLFLITSYSTKANQATTTTGNNSVATGGTTTAERVNPTPQVIEIKGPVVYRNEFPEYVKWDEEDVKKVQTALGVTATGQFGPETGNAIHDFQNRKGLGVDGVVGVYTLKKLGITELRSQSNLRYIADLETIAKKSTSDYLIYTSVFSRKLAIYHRESEGYWKCVVFADCGVGKNSSMTPLGEDVIDRKMLSIPYENTYRCYAVFFSGDYGIHSTSCTTIDPTNGRFEDIEKQIGRKITLGGIQIEPEIAKFIYDNCGNGTYVIRDDRDLKDYDPFSINH